MGKFLTLLFALFLQSNCLRAETVTITPWTNFTMLIDGSTTAPTKATHRVIDSASWRRVGDSMDIRYSYSHTDNTGAAPGSGIYLFELPASALIDPLKVYLSVDPLINSVVGSAAVSVSSGSPTNFTATVWAYDDTHLAIYLGDGTGVPPSGNPFGSVYAALDHSLVSFQFQATVPIKDWSTK